MSTKKNYHEFNPSNFYYECVEMFDKVTKDMVLNTPIDSERQVQEYIMENLPRVVKKIVDVESIEHSYYIMQLYECYESLESELFAHSYHTEL